MDKLPKTQTTNETTNNSYIDYEKEIMVLKQEIKKLNDECNCFMSECEHLRTDNEKLYTKIVAYENVIKWQAGIWSENNDR